MDKVVEILYCKSVNVEFTRNILTSAFEFKKEYSEKFKATTVIELFKSMSVSTFMTRTGSLRYY